MTAPLRLILACCALSAVPAAAAERNFGVSGFDRVRVEGPYSVRLTVGVAPFARASGSPRALEGVALDVQGRTLVVRPSRSSWGGYPGEQAGPVEIAIGTHELSAAWVNGSGSLAIDKVRSLAFELSVQGAGSASIASLEVDQLKLSVAGSGTAQLSGRSARVSAMVRGSSLLEAGSLAVKDAVLGAEGPSTIRARISGTAKVDAIGAAQVKITGRPACIVRTAGSATVLGCSS
ncbi:MAG TPA: DUF2807 domain-containing protein [Sphingomicrobium sp.]|nr:DUF2807 domain-containing protein [Sphingomicrobium sp.]